MRYLALLFVAFGITGCAPFLPGVWSARGRFLKENPGVQILTLKKQEIIDPEHTPPQVGTLRYADFIFRYRDADGVEREEVWHYKHSIHGWYFYRKEQTR